MLSVEERRKAGRALAIEMTYMTCSQTIKEAARKVGISESAASNWKQAGKAPPTGASARVIAKIVKASPPERRTPERVAKLYRLAARSTGYEV